MVFQLSCALNSGVTNLANFNRVELVPLSLVKILIEISNEFGVNEVEKGIAYIAVILYKRAVTL